MQKWRRADQDIHNETRTSVREGQHCASISATAGKGSEIQGDLENEH